MLVGNWLTEFVSKDDFQVSIDDFDIAEAKLQVEILSELDQVNNSQENWIKCISHHIFT